MVFYNNTGSYYFKTLQIPLAASQLVVFWTILKYYPRYYCQIPLQVILTVPFLQKTNNSLKNIAIDCSKIIETICYVTNTLPPSYNDHNTLFHIITTQHGMVARNSHYSNLTLDTSSHCGPIFIYDR